MTEQKELNVTVDLSKPETMINFAKTLKQVIIENHLYADIKGKNYVLVEGWQFLGGMLGVVAKSDGLEDISTENEIRYKAKATLIRLDTNEVIGSAEAMCSVKERGKGAFEEYAVASMAQTRAIGKAYRLAFGWIVKMAGYEATPAEEVNTDLVNADGEEQTEDEFIKETKEAVGGTAK